MLRYFQFPIKFLLTSHTVQGTPSCASKKISWLAPLLSSPLLSFLYHATTRSTSYIRPRSGIYTSLNARFRWPTWQLKAAFLVAKNDLPGMDQRPPTRMPIYGQPRGRASIDTSGWEGRA